MDKDIAPELIENVNKAFEINCMKDGNMQAMAKKLESGAASYEDAYKYAVSVGNARAKAFKSEINSDILPDGRMYYNIADRLINDSLGTDHDMVADYAVRVQDLYNQKENIRLKAQKADKDEDRIKGFIDRLDSEKNFDDVSWILDEPVKVHAMSVVDNTIKKNAEFQSKAGLKATVTRDAKSDCCGWCTDLAGDYIYPGVPREVFARHDNCRCTLDYAGRRLSAYETGGKAHSFRDQGEQERIEDRKKLVEYTDRNGIIKVETGGEKSRSHRMHNEKYGEGALLVNDKYISSDEYQNKFLGITGNSDVDNIICEQSRIILKERSGTNKETLVLLDKSNGNTILTIKGTKDGSISYSDKDLEIIAEAKRNNIEIVGIHNHPTGYPPTADDCVSALTRGYDLGITAGHNGTVHTYYPADSFFTKEECEEIHSIIAQECEFKTNINDVLEIWKKDLLDFGMTVKERR